MHICVVQLESWSLPPRPQQGRLSDMHAFIVNVLFGKQGRKAEDDVKDDLQMKF